MKTLMWPGVVVHTYNPSAGKLREADMTQVEWVQDQSGLDSATSFPRKKEKVLQEWTELSLLLWLMRK